MKCACGKKEAVKPNRGESPDGYMRRAICGDCGNIGDWELIVDDVRWD